MSQPEQFDILILDSGKSGKLLAWHMAQSGRRAAVVERRWIGGSCPNIACLPTKNVIHSAKVASLVARHQEFGIEAGTIAIDMKRVYARKREMVDGIVKVHLNKYHSPERKSSAETASSSRLGPFRSHCMMAVNARSQLTGFL